VRNVLVALALGALAAGCGGRVEGAVDAGEAADAAPTGDAEQATRAPEAAPEDVALIDVTDEGETTGPDANACYQPPGNAAPAHFQLLIDGVAESPYPCPSSPWDYPAPPESHPSVVLVNDGPAPIAYTASPVWNTSPPTLPGMPSGPASPSELYGVLDPGMKVDISSTFTATAANGYGIIAVVGSASPFRTPVFLLSDQGLTNWPAGVSGSGGSNTMYVVQVAASAGCQTFAQFW
jgi:hypothetical protein